MGKEQPRLASASQCGGMGRAGQSDVSPLGDRKGTGPTWASPGPLPLCLGAGCHPLAQPCLGFTPRPSLGVFSTSLRQLHGPSAHKARPRCRSWLLCPRPTGATGLSRWLYLLHFASCFCFFFSFFFLSILSSDQKIPESSLPRTLPETLQLKTA